MQHSYLVEAPVLLCNQHCNDFFVTFNLCRIAGLLGEDLNFMCNLPRISSDLGSESRGLSSAIVGLSKETLMPRSLCRSSVIASFTSKSSFLAGFTPTLLGPKMINMSSLTGIPAIRSRIDLSNWERQISECQDISFKLMLPFFTTVVVC